jgi:hypothetical protein
MSAGCWTCTGASSASSESLPRRAGGRETVPRVGAGADHHGAHVPPPAQAAHGRAGCVSGEAGSGKRELDAEARRRLGAPRRSSSRRSTCPSQYPRPSPSSHYPWRVPQGGERCTRASGSGWGYFRCLLLNSVTLYFVLGEGGLILVADMVRRARVPGAAGGVHAQQQHVRHRAPRAPTSTCSCSDSGPPPSSSERSPQRCSVVKAVSASNATTLQPRVAICRPLAPRSSPTPTNALICRRCCRLQWRQVQFRYVYSQQFTVGFSPV